MAARPKVRIISKIWEKELPYPIVVHVFNGETLKQANGFFQAHMKTDAFMRECIEKGHFADFACREEHHIERYRGGRWHRVAR